MAIACQWISDGTAHERAQWQTLEVTRRWRLAKKLLGAAMYQSDTPSPHIWLSVAEGDVSLAEACRGAGVDVVPGDVFAVKSTTINGVRISLTAAESALTLKVALERIAGIIRLDKNLQERACSR